jgi:hypothetical protein
VKEKWYVSKHSLVTLPESLLFFFIMPNLRHTKRQWLAEAADLFTLNSIYHESISDE